MYTTAPLDLSGAILQVAGNRPLIGSLGNKLKQPG